jgi:hypothetical protein
MPRNTSVTLSDHFEQFVASEVASASGTSAKSSARACGCWSAKSVPSRRSAPRSTKA